MSATALAPAAGVAVRDAVPGDDAALVALAAACPMAGDIGLCVDRAPEFFALNRLEGGRWRAGVALAADGSVAGCIAAAERTAYVRGRAAPTVYVSDLKVHPRHRGGGGADALSAWARGAARDFCGGDVLATMTVLAGNAPMERRAAGPRGLPPLERFATLQAWAVPLLWPRREREARVRVTEAEARDLEEMAALWARVAPGRQLAPVMGAAALADWVARAPGLALGDYLLARRGDGRLAGFVGLWDQSSFKRLRVTGYSRRLAAVRLAVNAAAPLAGATPLPPAGRPLRSLCCVHLCVPAGEPKVLRALLLHAYATRRGRGHSFLTIGLDARDPLRAALGGLWAQPTAVHAYATTPDGRYAGPTLGALPLHHEVALV
ncbi:MAG: hypothetical protein ACJ79S_11570 [Gemmatimonadaceae bacterium]